MYNQELLTHLTDFKRVIARRQAIKGMQFSLSENYSCEPDTAVHYSLEAVFRTSSKLLTPAVSSTAATLGLYWPCIYFCCPHSLLG